MNVNNIKTLIFRATVSSLIFFIGGCQLNEDPQKVLESKNLAKAIYCMDALENLHDIEIADRDCFAESYIQHSPHVADGKEAVLKIFANRFEKYPEFAMKIKRTGADGDLIWMHMHTKRSPEELGRAVINIFRMEDGKFAEHWNVGQNVPEKSKNNNTMF